MDDLIKRADAIDALSRSSVYAWSTEQDQTAHNWALSIINEIPSADAVGEKENDGFNTCNNNNNNADADYKSHIRLIDNAPSADTVSREVYDAMAKHAKALENLSIEYRVRIMYDAIEDIHNIRIINEVVRCKDCRWFKQDSSPVGYGYCDGRMVGREVDYNDYCSYGERRKK